MIGCATTNKAGYTFPPCPEREEIETPHTVQECAVVIIYYEYLLREWETWGDTVLKMTGQK